MKKRNFDPELFSDDRLAECGVYALPLYLGLLCQADSDGKLEDRPVKIKAKVFPYFTQVNINSELDALSDVGLIDRYEVDGVKVIKIKNFENLGISYNNEKASGLPDKPTTNQLPTSCLPADDQLNNININNNINFNIKEGECEGEIEKPKPKTASPLPEIPIELEVVRRDLENWIAYKRERGKTYKPSGLTALFGRLKNFSPSTVASAIQTSMANNWDGLFPEKAQGSQGYRPINSAQAQQDMLDRIIAEEEAKLHG